MQERVKESVSERPEITVTRCTSERAFIKYVPEKDIMRTISQCFLVE